MEKISLFLWIVIFQLVGILLGLFTKANMDPWYLTLEKSGLTPPDIVFSIVWPILYVMIAAAGWHLWRVKNYVGERLAKTCYVLQVFFNWSWTPIFFVYHQIGMALICIGLMSVFTFMTMCFSYKNRLATAVLLAHYFLWSLFA